MWHIFTNCLPEALVGSQGLGNNVSILLAAEIRFGPKKAKNNNLLRLLFQILPRFLNDSSPNLLQQLVQIDCVNMILCAPDANGCSAYEREMTSLSGALFVPTPASCNNCHRSAKSLLIALHSWIHKYTNTQIHKYTYTKIHLQPHVSLVTG